MEIGQELKPLVKGPITMTDEIAFLIGGGAPIPRLTAMLRHSSSIVVIRHGHSVTP